MSFIVMPDAGLGTNEHLRMGGQDSILMYNRQSDDATLPDMSPQGTTTSEPLAAGSWQCLEYRVSSTGLIETWLNSEAISGLEVGAGISNPNANGWGSAYKPDITGVYFGWESYGGAPNTFWYDDVAIEASRVGCAVTGNGGTNLSPLASSPSRSGSVPSSSATAPSSSTVPAKASSTLVTSSAASPTSSSPAAAGTVSHYDQCGGTGWTGGTVWAAPYTCTVVNSYYSQCE